MAKIKVKKTMNLPELIQWAWDKNVRSKTFLIDSNQESGICFDEGWDFHMYNVDFIRSSDTFTVETEEEITEETQIYRLLELKDSFIFKDGGWKDLNIMKSNMYGNQSISEVKNDESKKFYMLNEDDTMTLIWKYGAMVE